MITMKIKKLVFNEQIVQRAVDRAKRIVLGKSADAIRDRARASMPTAPGLAAPGQPPRMESAWLRRSVVAAWDRSTQTALAGPERRSGAGAGEERMLMRVLEFGGRYALGRRAKRRRRLPPHERVVVTVERKPYMGPALEKERPNLPRRWAGSVRG